MSLSELDWARIRDVAAFMAGWNACARESGVVGLQE